MSSQRSDWRERLNANPSRMEQKLAIKLQEDGIPYQTQVEITVTTADFYFSLGSRPLLAFVDGQVHHRATQMVKDEDVRTGSEVSNRMPVMSSRSDDRDVDEGAN